MCETKIQSLKKSVREIGSYLVDTIVDGIIGTTFLLLFLAAGFFLAIYISLIQVSDNIMELLNVSFSVILVAITAVYVKFTGQIVNQTNKNSEIAFIEKRLEKLYYPLKDVLQNPTNMYFVGDKKERIDLNKIDNIIPFQYLASKNIEDLLNDFINIALAERTNTDNEYSNYAPYEIVTEDIKIKVNEDIETYKNELKKLIKHRD